MIALTTLNLSFGYVFAIAFGGVVLGILIGTLTCREIRNSDTDRDASDDQKTL